MKTGKIKKELNTETNTSKRYSKQENLRIHQIFRSTINWIIGVRGGAVG
jgi:hypothetical protein